MLKVVGLYTEMHLYALWNFMDENKFDSCIDTADTVWYKKDVENILVNQYGYSHIAV